MKTGLGKATRRFALTAMFLCLTGQLAPGAESPRPIGVGIPPGFEVPGPVDNPRAGADAALEWLAAHRSKHGEFGLAEGESAREAGLGVVAITSLAALAFAEGGYTHRNDPHQETVKKAMVMVGLAFSSTSPHLRRADDPGFLTARAIQTLAAAELAHRLKPSSICRRAAKEGAAWLLESRVPGSGWSATGQGGPVDSVATAWACLALAACKRGGYATDLDKVFKEAANWFDAVTDPESGKTWNRRDDTGKKIPAAGFGHPETLMALVLAARLDTGARLSDPAVRRGGERLGAHLPAWDDASGSGSMLYWYLGTRCARQIGGATWTSWEPAVKAVLMKWQETSGEHRGSWPAASPRDRARATALGALTLFALGDRSAEAGAGPALPVDERPLPRPPSPRRIRPAPGRAIQPPVSSQAIPSMRDDFWRIGLNFSGQPTVDGKPYSWAAFANQLAFKAKMTREDKDPRAASAKILLKADQELPWAYVRHVLRMCAAPPAGLRFVFFEVRDPRFKDGYQLAAYLPVWGGPLQARSGGSAASDERARVILKASKEGEVRVYLGQKFLGQDMAGLERLAPALDGLRTEQRIRAMIIHADGEVPFGSVIAAMDAGIAANYCAIEFAE